MPFIMRGKILPITQSILGLEVHVSFIRNRFIRNLIQDSQKFKKLLELLGRSQETLEISVPSFTVP